jgi:PAS domain S-box-containing protein
MTDYGELSKAGLIDKLRDLEARIAADALQTAEHTIERKRDQAALRDSEARLRAILNTAVEGIITIDERGNIESFNAAAETIFGYQAEEIIGRNVKTLMPEPYRGKHDGYLANYAQTGHARIIGIGREVVGRRKDGTVFPMDLSVSEVRLEARRLFTGFVRDITERKRLEKEVLEISDGERRSLGQGLHDGLCQHLAGIELMSQVLEQNVARKSKPAAAQAGKIAQHVREAISQTRMLARGLSPVSIESNGLMSALQELATTVSKLFQVDCRFECAEPMLVNDNTAATHLYRIAQEAINNAIKHGKATRILIRLEPKPGEADTSGESKMVGARGLVSPTLSCPVHHGEAATAPGGSRKSTVMGEAELSVTDNGVGLPKKTTATGGMGLQIMKYRAGMIGASLQIGPAARKGTAVVCVFKA